MGQGIIELVKTVSDAEFVFIDTAPMIYHLEIVVPYFSVTKEIFRALANRNRKPILSMVSVTEIVTKPFREGQQEFVDNFEKYVLPQIDLRAITYEMAKRAGKLRSQYTLKTPDALVASTALESGCHLFITNDKDLRRLEAEGIAVMVVSDYVSTAD